MRVGVVGAGTVGRRRAIIANQFESTPVTVVADLDTQKARSLASELGCLAADWQEVVASRDVDIVIVSTWPRAHALVAIAATQQGKHVLCEKPFGRSPDEARSIVESAAAHGVRLKAGFNFRHKAGVRKARELFDQGVIGDLMLIVCRHGHGARPGYEREWLMERDLGKGGQLVELGVHGIDLIRWFMGEPQRVCAGTATTFWDIAPREDNAFVVFDYGTSQIASLHSSCTQWKNLFSFELLGKNGYIGVNGAGGSYGTERLTLGIRKPGSIPVEQYFEFPDDDISWRDEWAEFIASLREDREPLGSGTDALRALTLAYAAYASAYRLDG